LSLLPWTAFAGTEADLQQSLAVQSMQSEESDGNQNEGSDSGEGELQETIEAESPEEPAEKPEAPAVLEEPAPAEEPGAGEAPKSVTSESPETGTTDITEPIPIDAEQLIVSGVVDKTYTGQPVTQDESAVVVTLGEEELTAGEDYTISYEDNVNAGDAFVVISGTGDYTGEVRIAFTINPRSLSKATVSGVTSKPYTGKAIAQEPVVTVGGVTLVKGTDYKLSYKDNKLVGTATMTITGLGNYKGTATRTFKITDKTARTITLGTLKCSFKVKAYVNYRLPYAARPENLYLTARKGRMMELKWTDCRAAGAAIDGYIILRKTKPSGTYTEIKRVGAGTVTYTDKSTKKDNQMYYYAVVGYQKKSDTLFIVSPARNVGGVTYESKASNPYSVTISSKTLLLYKGQKKTLTLNFSKYKRVCSTWTRWTSSDTSVATVDSTGKVTAKSEGKATIYARTANGRKVSCVVTVRKAPYSIVVELAKKEVGYKGTGSGTYGHRYSKYAKELDEMGDIYNTPKYGYDWCDIFADWCYIKAMGKEKALKAINQPKNGTGAGCYFSASFYKSMGRFYQTPSIGAQIFFDWGGDGREDHTGIVVKYDAKYVYTIEGNAGGGAGQVMERKYERTYKCITGYGKPKW
ncbi:MAG: Ig-like domain-containing protein, partial [Firmicutes bacterium]|nr:Ig-like domain-containing protein [Bacillota bacterium]